MMTIETAKAILANFEEYKANGGLWENLPEMQKEVLTEATECLTAN